MDRLRVGKKCAPQSLGRLGTPEGATTYHPSRVGVNLSLQDSRQNPRYPPVVGDLWSGSGKVSGSSPGPTTDLSGGRRCGRTDATYTGASFHRKYLQNSVSTVICLSFVTPHVLIQWTQSDPKRDIVSGVGEPWGPDEVFIS